MQRQKCQYCVIVQILRDLNVYCCTPPTLSRAYMRVCIYLCASRQTEPRDSKQISL